MFILPWQLIDCELPFLLLSWCACFFSCSIWAFFSGTQNVQCTTQSGSGSGEKRQWNWKIIPRYYICKKTEEDVRGFDYLCMRYMKFAWIISFSFVYIFGVAVEKNWSAEKKELKNFVRVKSKAWQTLSNWSYVKN